MQQIGSRCRNLNYWDSVSTLAGEVPMAQILFPRAIGAAVVLVVLTYLLPLMAGLGVMGAAQEWKTGFFTVVAKQVCRLVPIDAASFAWLFRSLHAHEEAWIPLVGGKSDHLAKHDPV